MCSRQNVRQRLKEGVGENIYGSCALAKMKETMNGLKTCMGSEEWPMCFTEGFLFPDALQMIMVSYALTLSATMIPYSKGSTDDALFEGVVQGMVWQNFSLTLFHVLEPF